MFRHIEQSAAASYVHGDVDQRFADTRHLVVPPLVFASNSSTVTTVSLDRQNLSQQVEQCTSVNVGLLLSGWASDHDGLTIPRAQGLNLQLHRASTRQSLVEVSALAQSLKTGCVNAGVGALLGGAIGKYTAGVWFGPQAAIGALVLGGGSALVQYLDIYTAQTSDAVLDALTVTAQDLAYADGGLLNEQERELLLDCRQRADACMRQAPRTVYAALEAQLRQQGRLVGAL